MADEDHPLSHIAEFERAEVQPDEPMPTHQRLRAFEDLVLGEGVERHHGKIEKGIGSKFANLHPAHKAHIAAIEHLVEVEAEHAAAEAHLASVHAKVERALSRVAATEEASAAAGEA